MSKNKKSEKKNGGPFLAAAVYCHTIVSDPEGHMTPASIFDTLTIVLPRSAPPNFPSEEERLPVPVWSFISFRSGDAPGDHNFYMVIESPSGKKEKKEEKTIKLTEGAQGGFNLNTKITFGIVKGGLFWTNVYLDNKLVTRMPLLIHVLREGAAKDSDAAEETSKKKKGEGEAK
jgi:hypothetical protein